MNSELKTFFRIVNKPNNFTTEKQEVRKTFFEWELENSEELQEELRKNMEFQKKYFDWAELIKTFDDSDVDDLDVDDIDDDGDDSNDDGDDSNDDNNDSLEDASARIDKLFKIAQIFNKMN